MFYSSSFLWFLNCTFKIDIYVYQNSLITGFFPYFLKPQATEIITIECMTNMALKGILKLFLSFKNYAGVLLNWIESNNSMHITYDKLLRSIKGTFKIPIVFTN